MGGERRRKVGMNPSKRADGEPVSQDSSQCAIAFVLFWPETVAVLDVYAPSGDVADPRAKSIVDADVFSKDFAAPAIVIAGDHQHRNARVHHLCKRGEGSKAAARQHRAPLEPELEEIAIDHDRARRLCGIAQKRDDGLFHVRRRKADMRVGEDVTRRFEHARILPTRPSLYKRRRPNDPSPVTSNEPGAGAPPTHHDVEFRVRYAETDQMGVVYHTNYLIWCEVGRTDFIRARGMSYADMERAGFGLAVSELSARFHSAARYDDMIRVRTTLADVRSRGITFDYLITRAESGERLVSARTALVSIDAKGRPVSLPADVRRLFEPS